MDGDPIAFGHSSLIDQGPEGSGESTAERGSGYRVDGLGNGDQVHVGVVNRDQLRE